MQSGTGSTPDWNLVCVANFEDNLIVDVDNLQEAYKMGMPKVPDTFTVQSPKGFHIYFRHTERSRTVGNRIVQCVAELKANKLSCCAPGCTRADGGVYKVEDPSPIVPIPDDYLDWFEAQDPRRALKGSKPVDDDFDFEDFCDFYGIEVRGDGPKYYPAFCPVKGDIHHTDKGRPDLGACMLYFDGETLGWKDLAANCEGASMTIGGLIKFLNNQKGEPYPHPIWPETPIESTDAFPFEAPTDPPRPPPVETIEEATKPEVSMEAFLAAFPKAKEIKHPELRFPHEAIPAGRFKQLVDKACEGGLDAGLVVPTLFALASALPFEDRMDGDRINEYVCLLALVGAGKDVAMSRGLAVLGLEELEGAVYTYHTPSGERALPTLLGDKPGTKGDPGVKPGFPRHVVITPEMEETLRKSRAETSGVLQCLQYFYDHNVKTFVNRHEGTSKVNCRLSWLTALPVGNQEIDTEAFKAAFGENASHGIASRMLFGFAEMRIDPRQSRNWSVPYDFNHYDTTVVNDGGLGPDASGASIVQEAVIKDSLVSQLRKHVVKGFAPGVEQQYLDWNPKDDLSGRDFQHVHKVAILCALLQGHELIEQTDWDFALAFMAWQHAIREQFSTSRARQMKQAEFSEAVMEQIIARTRRLISVGKGDKYTKILEENGQKSYYILWSKLSNANRWYKYGMDAEKTINLLVRGSHLQYWTETDYDAQGKETRFTEHKAWVKVVNFHQLEKR